MQPWELHPALIHFPIALLLAGVAVELVARLGRRVSLARAGAALIVAGVAAGVIAAAAGAVSYFTVPAHTEAAHHQMETHLVVASAALVLFAIVAVARWRRRDRPASALALSGGVVASVLLIAAAFLGGQAVYHGGAGVDPAILAPEIAQGHHHHGDEAADVDEDHAHATGHAHETSGSEAGSIAEAHSHSDDHHHHEHSHPTASRPGRPHEQTPLFDPDEDVAQRSPLIR
jgi:uncharacterized membrane protein